VGERKVTVLVFGKYFDLRDPLSSVFAQVFTNRAVAGVKHTLGWLQSSQNLLRKFDYHYRPRFENMRKRPSKQILGRGGLG
jgi:hypothetical protein